MSKNPNLNVPTDANGEPLNGLVYASNGTFALPAVDSTDVNTDANGVPFAYPRIGLRDQPNRGRQTPTAFWNNQAVGAGGTSAAHQTFALWGKGQIFATVSAPTNLTLQYSNDNVTWFDVTTDNTGTIWTLALVTGHLSACRDLPGAPGNWMRLISSAAATITAGDALVGI